jgi:hypothetical protein
MANQAVAVRISAQSRGKSSCSPRLIAKVFDPFVGGLLGHQLKNESGETRLPKG